MNAHQCQVRYRVRTAKTPMRISVRSLPLCLDGQPTTSNQQSYLMSRGPSLNEQGCFDIYASHSPTKSLSLLSSLVGWLPFVSFRSRPGHPTRPASVQMQASLKDRRGRRQFSGLLLFCREEGILLDTCRLFPHQTMPRFVEQNIHGLQVLLSLAYMQHGHDKDDGIEGLRDNPSP